MAHLNIDARRAMVGKVLNAGIQIASREAKVLGVVFNCSQSAIAADVKLLRVVPSTSVSPGRPAKPAREIDR